MLKNFKKNKKKIIKNLWKNYSLKKLTVIIKKSIGKNSKGNIVSYQRGGGVKKKYRILDFKRYFFNIPSFILRTEYDPYRNAHISLIFYVNGYFSYILSTQNLNNFSFLLSGIFSEIKNGNSLPLKYIPNGTIIHNIEIRKGKGAQFSRSAGTFGQLLSKNIYNQYLNLIKLRSLEEYLIHENCIVTIGQVSNKDYRHKIKVKAGYSRRKNKRPHVRGVAMNPVDHPHGGGEGKTSGGRPSVNFLGKLTKGVPTRKKNKSSIYIYRKKHSKKINKI